MTKLLRTELLNDSEAVGFKLYFQAEGFEAPLTVVIKEGMSAREIMSLNAEIKIIKCTELQRPQITQLLSGFIIDYANKPYALKD